jgi:hypothetical protein
MKDSLLSRNMSEHEMRLVAAFFGDIKSYFVEIGANDPREHHGISGRPGGPAS